MVLKNVRAKRDEGKEEGRVHMGRKSMVHKNVRAKRDEGKEE